jgi:hypothetical protein
MMYVPRRTYMLSHSNVQRVRQKREREREREEEDGRCVCARSRTGRLAHPRCLEAAQLAVDAGARAGAAGRVALALVRKVSVKESWLSTHAADDAVPVLGAQAGQAIRPLGRVLQEPVQPAILPAPAHVHARSARCTHARSAARQHTHRRTERQSDTQTHR